MKSAIQSFKETKRFNESKYNQELNEIFTKIDSAIEDGLFYVSGIGSLSFDTLHTLKELGYVAQNDIFKGNNHYWISWIPIDTYTKKFDEKVSKLYNENNEQIMNIKQTLKHQKISRIVYSFIGGFVGYYIGKLIFYLLTMLL